MLTKKQISEIKEHLERAQNPLFFFDNDQDGLCSFLLLRRYLERGKGVPVKTFPDLSVDYFRKVKELKTDYIFILDKPVVSKEFWDEIEKVNIPVVWIDHHPIDRKDIPDFVSYYNPLYNKSAESEPVTDLCYQVTQRKEDLWIAVVGCIADHYIPGFYKEFMKKYPDLSVDSKKPFDIFYGSPIGSIGKMMGFGLKDSFTNVINMLKFLIEVKSPYDVLNEDNKNKAIYTRFNEVNEKYQRLMEKALDNSPNKVLFFQYGGVMSLSADLANELSYKFPDKVVVVIYTTGIKANISVRGNKIRDLVLKAIKGLKDATGGGHENAVGAKVMIEDLEKFKKKIESLVEKKK
jgi:single-stranded DNA-specific DHH superfamily exonuclease